MNTSFPINNNIFYLNNFTILLNQVVGWQSRSFLGDLMQYFTKNMALLVKHFFPLTTKGEGWGEACIFKFKKPFQSELYLEI